MYPNTSIIKNIKIIIKEQNLAQIESKYKSELRILFDKKDPKKVKTILEHPITEL